MTGILFWFLIYLVVMAVTLWLFTTLMGASRDDPAPSNNPVHGAERKSAPRGPAGDASRAPV